MLVDVKIEAPGDQLDQHGSEAMPVPLPWHGLGLIDTGADVSCVNVGVAQALNIKPVTRYRVNTPSGVEVRDVYQLRVTLGAGLDNPPDPIDVKAPEVQIAVGTMLIGRDVLGRGELAWYGPDARFEWVLPRSRG